MPSVSKRQRKFMGIVHAIQEGKMKATEAGTNARKAAESMSHSDVKEYAETKEAGLPLKKKLAQRKISRA